MVELNQIYLLGLCSIITVISTGNKTKQNLFFFFKSDFGSYSDGKQSERHDMVEMILEMCEFFGLRRFMEAREKDIGLRLATQKGQILRVSNLFGNILYLVFFLLEKYSKSF